MNKMVKNQTGKKILKGKTQRYFIFMTFFICGGGLMLCWLFLRINFILNHINIWFLEYFLFSGFIFFWIGMKVLVSYIKVYENGIKVRKNGMINYVTTRFIHFSQINEIRLKGKIYPHLILQLAAEEIIVPTILIKNYKEIMNEISNHIGLFKQMNEKQKSKFKNLNDLGISEKEELTSISVTQIKDKFNSEDFVGKYLQNGEKVLWDQVKLVNLTDTRNLVIGIAILLSVLLVFLYLFTIVLGDDQVILISINTIITVVFLGMIPYFIFHSVKITRKRKQELQLTRRELKRIIHFDTITNQRYIRRNFYRDIDLYNAGFHIEGLELKDHLLFISLNRVDNVVIDDLYNRIVFILQTEKKDIKNENDVTHNDPKFLNASFSPFDLKDWNFLTNIVREIIPKKKLIE